MIYLDNAATTKPDKNAVLKAYKFNEEEFFNPSALYRGGIKVSKELDKTRERVLKNLGASSSLYEVLFTSCGTESDVTAIFGVVKRGVFVTDKGEHSAVYKSFTELKNRNNKVEFVDLNKDGSVNIDKLFDTVKNTNADFVSIMHVNNETGAINDINYIAGELKKINPKLIFHSDGVQAYGKIPFVISSDIDMYSVSAHKINALKGVGALIKKKKLTINPIIFGGGQEKGVRSGTENVFGIKVFEYAGNIKYEHLTENFNHVSKVKDVFINGLDKDLFTIISSENSSPYILSVAVKDLRGEVIMHMLEDEGVIVGNGSACSSKNRYSRIIEACGYKKDLLDGVIRLSFSSETEISEAEDAVEKINATVKNLKGKII